MKELKEKDLDLATTLTKHKLMWASFVATHSPEDFAKLEESLVIGEWEWKKKKDEALPESAIEMQDASNSQMAINADAK